MTFNPMISNAIKRACKGEEPRYFIKKLILDYLYGKGFLVEASGALTIPRDTGRDDVKIATALSEDDIEKLEKRKRELRELVSEG